MKPSSINLSWVYIGLIIIAGFCVYFNSIQGEFIWDDYNLVVNNIYLRSIKYLPQIFSEQIGAGAGVHYTSYRPLQLITYMVDFQLDGLDPARYHKSNIIFHIAVALCLYWFLFKLFKDKALAFISSLLFVVHPIHTQAVSYISGRADSLAALFMLLAFICYLNYLENKRIGQVVLSIGCFILALFSRENVILLPLLLLLYHGVFSKKPERQIIDIFFLLVLIYIILRFTVLFFPSGKNSFSIFTLSFQRIYKIVPLIFITKLKLTLSAISKYISLLIAPFNLHIAYVAEKLTFFNPSVIIGFILLLFLPVYAWQKRRENSLIPFSILWFFICLLPAMNIYPLKYYMAEHWLYLPSVGFTAIIALLLLRFFRRKSKAIAVSLIVILVGYYSYLTIRQNTYWHNQKTFIKRTLYYSPTDSRLLNLLAFAHLREEEYDRAVEAARKAIKQDPNFVYGYYNLATAYLAKGDFKKAEEIYKKAIEIDDSISNLYNNLGYVYLKLGKIDRAIEAFKKEIQHHPYNEMAYLNLAKIYSARGQREKSKQMYDKILEINGITD